MTISPQTVWDQIWPTVEQLIEATLAENDEKIAPTLHPKGQARQMYDMFDRYVFDLLLKTVLGRANLSVTRAIETDDGRAVHIEFVWPEPDVKESYTAADLVSVKLKKYRGQWLILEINPAAVDLPLTEARATTILAGSKILGEAEGKLPQETWILPVALFGGALQITLREEGIKDDVERLFLEGMQARGYGVLSLLGARRMWRDFRAATSVALDPPKAWAASVEFVANEQAMREKTQAAVGKPYGVSMTTISSRVKEIKNVLNIQGLDERYTAIQREQIVWNNQETAASE